MKIFPAIDLFNGKAVRLLKGDYNNMTIYSDNPLSIALDFKKSGAEFMHVVDLEGAKTGDTPNLETVKKLISESGLKVEIGGGIRSMEVIDKYISAGAFRVILGTSAVENEQFLREALGKYGDKIAVGVDIKDGFVAIKGWTEKSSLEAFAFCEKLEKMGVKTIICTDISKDGAMQGTNRQLYSDLQKRVGVQIIASGGVTDMEDIKALRALNMYGAIVGRAYYQKTINLCEAIEVAR